ncbi:GNAT family protein [Gilvibacter sp.]|uniref:GNAT family N-acetyltransferase n=1 Tax=Gilvibacter sp. TaxID=2729997 RepID=UPI0025BD5368|nr:GNAT family protein [Gilvibacter sp.]NQX76184.1 GNAT family N-acetyltransferase [Gilvibacter sp.]
MDVKLSNDAVRLRALEPQDLDFLFEVENNTAIWEVSNTLVPYSRFVLKQYLEQAHLDIYSAKQLRLVICTAEDSKALGFVDLFDFDPKNKRVGVGIVVYEPDNRRQGYAREALSLLIPYCFDHLGLHQVFANIGAQNLASIQLFEALGFTKSGIKRDWHWTSAGFADELIYQKINE